MNKKISFVIVLIGLYLNTSIAQEMSNTFFKNVDEFFKKNVVNGQIDYSSIKERPVDLNDLIETISNFDWTKLQKGNDEKAFLINVYNILVIKAVLDNYPLKSVMDVKGFFEKSVIRINGENLSLNDVEKEILFKKYPDSRLHFVLVCAAIGCPKLINKAYFPEELESMLDRRTKITLNSKDYIRLDKESAIVYVSELFKWYQSDFTKNELTIIQYINQYREAKIPDHYNVKFITYDWSLNNIPEE
jgi:hypothetical protein